MFLKNFSPKLGPLSIILLFALQTASYGQAGPCGLTFAITNAANSYTNDGKITVSGIVNKIRLWVVKPNGVTVGMGEWHDVPTSTSHYLTGLQSGSYTLYYEQYTIANGTSICSGNQVFTIGAGALPTSLTTEISGAVFNDFNANGTRDNSDIGAANITIKAFNAANTQISTATSNSLGAYKLTGLTAAQPYRLEFTWNDTYVQSGALGTNSTSSVQFVNAGVADANFGVNVPSNYCQTSNPLVMLPCYVNGNPSAAAVSPMDAVVAYPYNASSRSSISTQVPAVSHVATTGQVGALWGMAYQKTTKYMFGSAVLRRHSGFGTLGTGGIYKINMTTPASPVTSTWVDVKTIGIPTGTDTRNGTPANTLSNSPGSPNWDAEAFNQIGKLGIGGIDFNDTGDTLWLVNMTDKKLYGIKNVNPSVTPTSANVIGGFPIVLPSGYTCATNPSEFRPWAVKYYKGLVYIGALCSGEATSWSPNNMRGYILSFNPSNTAAGFTHVANFPLNTARVTYGTSTNSFQSWVNNSFFNDFTIQPIVTDLEFDVDGSIIVGISDRGGFQMGYQNYKADPSATNTTLVNGDSYGDILKICRVGTTYVTEGNAGCTYPSNPFNTQEFYWGDLAPFGGSNANFMDNALGALAFVPSNGTFLATHQDPSIWYGGGTVAFSPLSGGDVHRYSVYDPSVPGAAGKATGLGDVEPLCDLAPIEVGNRVWSDTDRDGIQDAGEAGLANITLTLYNGATLIATTTTDALGNYKFTNLLPNTTYQIRIALNQTNLSGIPLSNKDVGSNDLIDNDMNRTGQLGFINFTTNSYGMNNHSFDIGFEPNCAATVVAAGADACIGGTISLTATPTPTGGIFTWTGPNGFTSSLQNPTIPNAQTVNAGTYSVTYDAPNGCSVSNLKAISVNAYPTAVAGANSPTLGGTLQLTASGGTSYAWSGPNSFTSTVQNPSITNVTAPMAGNYNVTVTNNGCSSTASVSVVFNCAGPLLNFNNPALISGTGVLGAVGSKYRFSNITTGVDGILTIVAKSHADISIISLDEPAATSGGYNEAMQPIIDYNWINGDGTYDAAGEKKVTFQLDFVAATTTTPMPLALINMTAIDVDGSGDEVREFFETTGFTSYAVQTPTSLTVTGAVKAKGAIGTKPGIDETALDAMISMGFASVASITFSYGGDFNGVTNLGFVDVDEKRLNSLQFKCYPFNTEVICPQVVVTTSGSGTICTGGDANLFSIVSGGAGTCTLNWQSSTNGTTWTNTGVTTATYATGALTATTYYRAIYTCSATYCSPDTSAALIITVIADPSVSVAANNSTICTGGVTTLTATVTGGNGTNSFQWQQFIAGAWANVGGNTTSFTTPTLTTNTDFRVIVTQTTLGCGATSTTTTINVVSDPSVSVVATATGVCVGGSVTLSATSAGGTGTCTFQWQSSPDGSVWSPIGGETNSTYTTPALSILARYRAQINCSGNGCCN